MEKIDRVENEGERKLSGKGRKDKKGEKKDGAQREEKQKEKNIEI